MAKRITKPNADRPLSAVSRYGLTRSGRGWFKRIGGKVRWIASLKKCPTAQAVDSYFERHFAEIASRQADRSVTTDIAVDDLAAEFLSAKQVGLHAKTVRDYEDTMLKMLRVIGPHEPAAALDDRAARSVAASLADLGAARRQKHIANMRNFVSWARARYPIGWTVEMFPAVSRRELRRDRAARGLRPYTPQQTRRLLRYGSDKLRAVILLGLNLAIGPDEMARLTIGDVKASTFTRPRSKNGIERLSPIWPETREACVRVSGNADGALALGGISADVVTRSFRRLCDRTGTPPFGAYNLRRTFRTIADDYGDQRAAAEVMGRELPDIDTVYVLHVRRERVEAMLAHVKASLQIVRSLAARRVPGWKKSLPKRVAARAARANP